jgi:ribosomal protein S18 acetylase RimI-like enzyme
LSTWDESGFTIRIATLGRDWDALSALRALAEQRVQDMGCDRTDLARGLDRMARYIDADQLYVVCQAGGLVACYALTPDGDPDFWTRQELAEDALYLDNAIVHPAHAHRGVGSLITRRAMTETADRGMESLRLDCQRVPGLRAHWERLGFTWLRDVEVPGRASGTLMERKLAAA